MKIDDVEVVSASEMSSEDARTKWDSITMNLGYLLASIIRVPEKLGGLSSIQRQNAIEWLQEQIEASGGHAVVHDVLRYVYSLIVRQ